MMDVTDQRSDELAEPLAIGAGGVRREESIRMESEMILTGAIVDSWVESARTASDATRLVLQVAPRERPKELVIVEAEASLR